MTRRGILQLIGVSAVAFGLNGCSESSSNKYRFRMTVEVQTPQGLRIGTSVFQVVAYNSTKPFTGEPTRQWGTQGQAVVVDLPDGPLFILMKENGKTGDVSDLTTLSMAVLDPKFKNDIVESAGRIAGSWSTLKGDVSRANYPLMVRFRDINDPKSVEEVSPYVIDVKRVWIETTRDSVTTGVENRLKWLLSHYAFVEQERDPKTGYASAPTEITIANTLKTADFSTELFK